VFGVQTTLESITVVVPFSNGCRECAGKSKVENIRRNGDAQWVFVHKFVDFDEEAA
jgi:hypothetical protein